MKEYICKGFRYAQKEADCKMGDDFILLVDYLDLDIVGDHISNVPIYRTSNVNFSFKLACHDPDRKQQNIIKYFDEYQQLYGRDYE